MRSFALSRLPAVSKGELCGVLTARDTRAKVCANGSDRTLTVVDAMSTDRESNEDGSTRCCCLE